MRKFNRVVLAFLATTSFTGMAHATISAAIPIRDSEVILNFSSSGLDWVYAGPIAPNEFGAGNIQPASYRAAEGWRTATASEWLLRPIWSDFTRTGFATPAPNAGFSNHTTYRFTSEYWSNFMHVDLSDFAAGRVTDGVNGVTSDVPETIYVRFNIPAGAVPEPATWAMMIGGFGLIGAAARRRRQRTTVTYA